MTTVPTVTLNNGVEIPRIGFGTAGMGDEDASRAVREALGVGYRHIDTAARYGNEVGVGRGIAGSGLARDDVFVCTKLRGNDQGYDATKAALDGSLLRLGLDHVDLYLIHWPLPRLERYVESWTAMEEMVSAGKVRAIGVSNFLPEHLDRLAAFSPTVPAVNQIELHPRYPQLARQADHARRGVVTVSWSPLAHARGLLDDDDLTAIARRHGKSAAQLVLRWHVQQGLVAIPKTSHVDRMRENLTVFDFELDGDEMAVLARLNTGKQVNDQDPRTYEEF